MMLRRLLFAMMLFAQAAFARDVYVLQGLARGVATDTDQTLWSTAAVFYNQAAEAREVRLIHVSNGGLSGTQPTTIVLLPHQSRRLQNVVHWYPAQGSPMWILHLEVPADVVVEASLYIGSSNLAGPSIPQPRRYGKTRLPTRDALVPANEEQVHLETHVGSLQAHTNVAVYNAGEVAATATINIYRACDDQLLLTNVVLVPPDTILQTGPFPTQAPCVPENTLYTIITVDQPSLTFVSSLADSGIPIASHTVN